MFRASSPKGRAFRPAVGVHHLIGGSHFPEGVRRGCPAWRCGFPAPPHAGCTTAILSHLPSWQVRRSFASWETQPNHGSRLGGRRPSSISLQGAVRGHENWTARRRKPDAEEVTDTGRRAAALASGIAGFSMPIGSDAGHQCRSERRGRYQVPGASRARELVRG
jgi:hypothetical protein